MHTLKEFYNYIYLKLTHKLPHIPSRHILTPHSLLTTYMQHLHVPPINSLYTNTIIASTHSTVTNTFLIVH